MATALVIGFDRFPGAPRNPSSDLVRAIARRRRPALARVKIVPAVLPTTYAAVANELPALLKRYDPDVVLLFGLASRAERVRIESRAVNAASAVHADAARAKLSGSQIVRGAPSELSVQAPLGRLAAAIRGSGVSLRHSRDAGRYICNASSVYAPGKRTSLGPAETDCVRSHSLAACTRSLQTTTPARPGSCGRSGARRAHDREQTRLTSWNGTKNPARVLKR